MDKRSLIIGLGVLVAGILLGVFIAMAVWPDRPAEPMVDEAPAP